MRIPVRVDDQELSERTRRGASLTASIWWEHGGESYPSEEWNDFGPIIVGWWLLAVTRMLAGTDEDEFLFMDGPYSIKAIYDHEARLVDLRPSGTDLRWKVTLDELGREIVNVAATLCDELARRGVGEEDRRNLQKLVVMVQAVLRATTDSC